MHQWTDVLMSVADVRGQHLNGKPWDVLHKRNNSFPCMENQGKCDLLCDQEMILSHTHQTLPVILVLVLFRKMVVVRIQHRACG